MISPANFFQEIRQIFPWPAIEIHASEKARKGD